jgi:hypothetical protein
MFENYLCTGYKIYRSSTVVATINNKATGSYVDRELNNGTQYSCQIVTTIIITLYGYILREVFPKANHTVIIGGLLNIRNSNISVHVVLAVKDYP